MARIRTIKPEFWTDEKIVQLPFQTRLLFIGMWNFSDDYGYLPDEPERIKMQILPSDPINPAVEIDTLISIGLVHRYGSEDGSTYLHIPHFKDHQKVDHPAKSKISREDSRKLAVPSAVRRALAKKYGCQPGESVDVECYYCGNPGQIVWWKTTKGQPSSWVSFSHEIDHFESEKSGGSTTCDNMVLACRECNRSKGAKDWVSFLLDSRESSRTLAPEGKGREEEGKGKEETTPPPTPMTMREISSLFLHYSGRLTVGGGENPILQDMASTYQRDWIEYAFQSAAAAGPQKFLSYALRVLQNRANEPPPDDMSADLASLRRKIEGGES